MGMMVDILSALMEIYMEVFSVAIFTSLTYPAVQ
jgi:hypothetical protein